MRPSFFIFCSLWLLPKIRNRKNWHSQLFAPGLWPEFRPLFTSPIRRCYNLLMQANQTQALKFSMASLGCARTLVDTEKMIDQLHQAGFQLTPEGAEDRIVILNTCSFIKAAVDETEANIESLISRKLKGEIEFVVVVGCYPSRFKKEELKKRFPAVDLWLTTFEESTIQSELGRLVFAQKYQPVTPRPYTKITPSHYAYIKISEGCDNWCTFCTIPKIRGTHTSKTLAEVLDEIKLQRAFGAKEVLLIAEDTTAWGIDTLGAPSYPALLEAIAQTEVPWVRNMYIFPSRVDEALVSTIKRYDNICNYIDMPIQHVNSELLERMNRRHDREFLERTMDRFFSQIPDFAWRTTFIVGFPGETESHVEELLDFIEKYPVEQLGCFPYSEERETRSAKYEQKVPEDVAKARIDRIMSRQLELVQQRAKTKVGKTITVLYDGNGFGRSYSDAPDVDGGVIIENAEGLRSGDFYTVKITGSDNYDLIAQPV